MSLVKKCMLYNYFLAKKKYFENCIDVYEVPQTFNVNNRFSFDSNNVTIFEKYQIILSYILFWTLCVDLYIFNILSWSKIKIYNLRSSKIKKLEANNVCYRQFRTILR